MFLALRDLRFARGRFALMGTVIALITLLVVMLSGLTAGLADESVSAVRALPADRLAFAAPADGDRVSFSASRLDARQVRDLAGRPGVTGAAPLGVAPARVRLGSHDVAVTVFGVEPAGFLAPAGLGQGAVVVGRRLADEWGLAVGDRITLGGRDWPVAGTAAEASFNHTPVVWLPLDAWRGLDSAAGADATVVALRTDPAAFRDPGAAGGTGTVVVPVGDALAAVGSYAAENGSLTLMRALLLVVSALVAGAFFTVWTVQRAADLAVLKAIGAGTWYLLRDAAVQALVVLAAGGVLGAAAAAGAGMLAVRAVPFVLSPGTILVPLLAMVGVGMAGALVAVRRITSVDPLSALGAAR